MSSTTITIMRCDRCGHETDPADAAAGSLLGISSFEPRAISWGKISAVETGVLDRKRAIGGVGREGDDLCPGCVEALFAWWQSPGDVVQPAPQPAPPRPLFTIEDRKLLEPILRDALRTQVAAACDAYRAEPTAAIGTSDLAAAYAAIDERATALAIRIIEQREAR